ncbi:MAG: hypothetical protein ACLS3M_04700 [Collinsella sp.]
MTAFKTLVFSPTASLPAAARPEQNYGIALRSAMYLKTLSEGAAYACSGNKPSGGYLSEAPRLRGQSIIEYVLIIAVIGLVIVFAGPGVASTIETNSTWSATR